MISALLFINLKGEIIISRYYRDNVRYDRTRKQQKNGSWPLDGCIRLGACCESLALTRACLLCFVACGSFAHPVAVPPMRSVPR
jgi:hypothetical protein